MFWWEIKIFQRNILMLFQRSRQQFIHFSQSGPRIFHQPCSNHGIVQKLFRNERRQFRIRVA